MRRDGAVRAAAVLPVVAVACAAMSGCSGSLSHRQLTVYFRSGTPQTALDAAARACGHAAPGVSPAPNPTPSGNSPAGLAGNTDEIRFFVGGADDHAIAQLTDCLHKQPGVIGVSAPNDDMS